MTPIRHVVLALTLSLSLVLTGCFGRDALSPQTIIAGAPTLINFLVSKGKLKPETGERIKTDFNEGAGCALTLENALDQVAKDDPEARSKKRAAWLTAVDCWKPIVLRQNFLADPQVQNVSNLVSDLFAAGVRFYTDRQRSEGPGGPAAPPDEKEFERDMERRMKDIKQAMKPKS